MKTKFFLPLLALLMVVQVAFGQTNKKARYVLAPSGLNMRQTSNPKSERITRIDYGMKVEYLSAPESDDMVIDGIPGGMARIKYNGMTGYAFDGFLCKYPGPAKERVSADFNTEYADQIRNAGFNVLFETIERDYGGYYQFETALVIDGGGLMDGYLIARELFTIPPKLYIPAPSDKSEEVAVNPEKKEYSWSDEITVKRNSSGEVTEILYYQRGEGGGRTVIVQWSPDEKKSVRVSQVGIAD